MLFKSLKLLIEKTWEIKLRIDILLKKHPIHSIYSFWMIFVKILKILRFSTNIFGNFYLYFSMYNITLSYFFWLFWRSKEHLFRNFFFFSNFLAHDHVILIAWRASGAHAEIYSDPFLYPAELFHAYRSFDISLTPGGVRYSEWYVIWPFLIRLTRSDDPWPWTYQSDTFSPSNQGGRYIQNR